MSDTVVKSDDLSVDPEVVVAVPTKTIVPERDDPALVQLHDAGNGDDHAAYETREDDQNEDNIRDEHPDVTKREDIGEDRDRAANFDNNSSITGSSQQHKKKVTTTGTSSSPGATRTKNTSNAGSNKHQLQQHFQQQQMQLQQQNANGARYYSNNNNSNIPPNMPGSRGGPMFPMARGFGGPPPYGGYPGGNYGPPPPHYHPPPHAPPSHHPHMMPPHYNNGPYAGPSGGMKGNYHPSMAYGGPGPGPYGMAPYPPIHHGMNPTFQGSNMSLAQQPSDSNSISSKSSMNSKKKRTIEGLQHHPHSKLPTSYSFRRSDSNSSAASTATAGNNTSTETHHTEDSHHPRSHRHHQHHPKRSTSCEADLSTLRMGGSSGSSVLNGNNDRRHRTTIRAGQQKPHYHRRDYSGTSTASSLSVGGLSLSSYERAGNLDDAMITDDMMKGSPKRHKRSNLVIDTGLPRPPSASVMLQPMEDDHPTHFEQLSIGTKPCTSTDSESSAEHSNLFLSLSTSPINADVDATPNMKNTAKEAKVVPKTNSIFKLKVEEKDRPSDTPTPPVHGELGDMMNDDHNMLNSHLRGQSFTPLDHLGADGNGLSPTNTAFASAVQPQLSWSIAGDTPSLGDLAEWEEETSGGKIKAESKARPSSTTSTDTRNMMISPHDFQLWKEEHELADRAVSGTTTPLPVFFEQSGNEQSENNMRFEGNMNKNNRHAEQMQNMMYNNARKHHEHHFWPKHDGMVAMPPTPMYAQSDYRDDGFAGHSPMHGDRRDMDYSMQHYPHHPGSNDRIRNLRGRLPPGANYPPMQLHIPPHISSHLPMTSPMGLIPGKPGMWSPHHGMCPPLGSPHLIGSPLNHMAQSKRKCVPLKPPIPSKFQGDMEKVKSAPVPEFTSLVNFPAHMSQKQSVNLPEGMRCCVMCGQACPCSNGTKGKKCKSSGSMDGGLVPRNSNVQDHLGDKNSGYAIIPSQNKGLCTLCDVNVWVVANSCLEIKWCKGCKNFRPWAAFGDKGLATKCLRCRERQREKYALQKEEKEKTRIVVPVILTKVKK